MQILLVEDNRVNQLVASLMLGDMDANVDIADCGKMALEFVSQKKYDIIFMDCQMPVMDGYSATAEIRKLEDAGEINKAPIVALTAHTMQGDRQKCLDAGMDDYMSKPVTEKAFADILRKWVGDYCDISHSQIMQKYRFKYVNAEDLEKLYVLMQDGFFNLMDIYFSTTKDLMAELKKGIADENYADVISAAHTISSPSRQIGSVHVAAKATEIEEMAKEEADIKDISVKFSTLREQLILAESELKFYIESKKE
jgi:CheY-like chemotaxis protein